MAAPLSLGYLNRGVADWWDEYDVGIAHNTNFREAQWKLFSLPDMRMDYVGESDNDQPGTRAAVVKSSLGTFSTGISLPMGALSRKDGKQCLVWQIEHSGSWRWELGNVLKGLYIVAGGPTDPDHQWTKKVAPGEMFCSVTTALCCIAGTLEESFVPITQYRRRIRRKHQDNEQLPVIFNDYMNCLKANPTTEKVTALIEPARKCGAEYFCIDAGWYADLTGEWWDTVGEWKPSTTRFPRGGLQAVLDKIRAAGMIPGLWMEPEVIGVRCPMVKAIPREAFFQKGGVLVEEQGRYQLDFRHPAVTLYLDKIVDNLITEYGIGYFKFDYNIDVTQGTDVAATSSGDGMLEHRRAYMSWINKIYNRFPSVVLETCSSGGQRLDYEMLATHSIQSTSDQQDPVLYSAISASIGTAVTPEQSASWAYPQPQYSDDLNALCVVNSLMGRVHLSGRIDLLSERQLDLVAEGISAYKSVRQDIKDSLPFWPFGLQPWNAHWLVLGLRSGDRNYLAVWRRGGDERCEIPMVDLVGRDISTALLYPKSFKTGLAWQRDMGVLTVTVPVTPSARLLLLK